MKNKLYELKISIPRIDREKAVALFIQRRELGKSTGMLVNSYKKMKLGIPSSVLNNIQFLKNDCKTVMNTPTRFILKRGEFNQDSTLNRTNLRNALREIRADIQDKRRRNKFMGDPIPFIRFDKNYWFNKQLAKAFENKKPNDGKEYIGIEIECLIPTDSGYEDSLMKYRKFLSIGCDGSIDCDSENEEERENGNCEDGDYWEGKEFRILVDRENLIDVVTGVTQTLKQCGAKVNKSCGLHVHFDMRHTEQEEREAIYSKLYHSLGLLYSIVPSSRRNNSYCRRNANSNYMEQMNGERYKAINVTSYQKHYTFEVRLFGGTIESKKILNWIELISGIIKGRMILRCPASFEIAQRYWNFSNEVLEWCKARQVKFGTVGVSVTHECDTENVQAELAAA